MQERARQRWNRRWSRVASPAAVAVLATLGALGCTRPEGVDIEVFPRHFDLRPGETIRYMPMERRLGGELEFFEDYEFETRNPDILRLRDRRGLFEAVAPGGTEFVVKSSRAERRYSVEVGGRTVPALQAVRHSEIDVIDEGEEVLFVGHANLDGFDHTAVAKPGIDRLVHEFKTRGRPVVYWVSEEYPDWYTEDRHPDLAIISEGQEHEILVDADRVVFTGGDFMYCLLRNAQMTLHGMVRAGRRDELHFIFPAEAIWTGLGAPRPYPVPMMLLSSVVGRYASNQERYDTIVVPFLDRLFTEYPVGGYPPDAPSPELAALVDGWNVDVLLGDTFERTYRQADSAKTIVLEFLAP